MGTVCPYGELDVLSYEESETSWTIHLGIFPRGKTGEPGMKTVAEEAGGWIMLKFSTRCEQSTYCELGDTEQTSCSWRDGTISLCT